MVLEMRVEIIVIVIMIEVMSKIIIFLVIVIVTEIMVKISHVIMVIELVLVLVEDMEFRIGIPPPLPSSWLSKLKVVENLEDTVNVSRLSGRRSG